MSNVDVVLKDALQIDGAIGVALVDYETGMSLGMAGGAGLDLDIAAAGNSDVVKAKLRTMAALGLEEKIEDILITLTSQYHLIRLVTARNGQGLMMYLALDKAKANLAMARRQLTNLEQDIHV